MLYNVVNVRVHFIYYTVYLYSVNKMYIKYHNMYSIVDESPAPIPEV